MNDSKTFDYDILVIGGGPAGYTAASYSAQFGKRVALLEKRQLGGTCLNRGCIPTKILLEAAHRYENVQDSADFGVITEQCSFSWDSLVIYMRDTIKKLRSGVEHLLSSRQVALLKGEARLLSGQAIQVDGKQISAEYIILATGSRPAVPVHFSGTDRVFTSDNFWDIEKLPASLVIVGGGAIGCEIASALSTLGVHILLIEQMPRLLSAFDETHVAPLIKEFRKKNVDMYPGSAVSDIQWNGGAVIITLDNGTRLNADALLWATGRAAALTREQASAIGLELTAKHFVAVDAHYKTNLPHLFCIGDANGRSLLAHSAIAQAMRVVNHICTGKAVDTEPLIPQCVYTAPALARAGISETEAKNAMYHYAAETVPYSAVGMSHAVKRVDGYFKIIRNLASDTLLGVEITGYNAYELIHILLPYIEKKLPCAMLDDILFAHPSLSEGLKIAVENTYIRSPQTPFSIS
jgi:dihydrolipoamide dehydrogenase